MNRILIISYAFVPANDPAVHRISRLAAHLPTFGWQADLLTVDKGAFFRKDETNNDYTSYFQNIFSVTSAVNQIINKILLTPKKRSLLRFLIKNFFLPDQYASWIRPAVKAGESLLEKQSYDCILATINPYSNGLIGEKLAQQFNIPLIIDYRDPWTLSQFHRANFFQHHINRFLEKRLLAQADQILVTSTPMKKLFVEHQYFPADKIAVITNGVDKYLQNIVNNDAPCSLDLNKINITYTGGFYNDRQPYDFLLAIKQLINNNPALKSKIKINFIGAEIDTKTKTIIQQANLPVKVYSAVNYKTAIQYLRYSDILLLINGKSDYNNIFIPAKFYDYLAVEKPILFIGKGEPANLIAQFEIGESAVHSVTKIREKLEKMLITNYEIKDYSILHMEPIVKKLTQLMERII